MNSAQGKITVRRAAKAGNDGSDAVVYELRPSVSSVKKTGTTYTPASLTCHVQKIVGGVYSTLTTAGELTLEQLALQYAIDGGTYTSINGTTAITPSGSIIYFRLIKDTIVIATMSVPIVSDGTNGAEGIEGRAIRTVKWVPGETYHNDAPTASAPRYIDILLIFDASGAVTTRYQCVSTYTSGELETVPTGDGNAHWTKVNNMGPLYTPMFMADNGDITFLSSNQILVKKADGTVTAGVSGAGTGSTGYRFWAGSDVPGNAPFWVDELGHLHSIDADIQGKITAVFEGNKIMIDPETGSIKMINPNNIEILNIHFVKESGANNYYPMLRMRSYIDVNIATETVVSPDHITLYNAIYNASTEMGLGYISMYDGNTLKAEMRSTNNSKYTLFLPSLPSYSQAVSGELYVENGIIKQKQ